MRKGCLIRSSLHAGTCYQCLRYHYLIWTSNLDWWQVKTYEIGLWNLLNLHIYKIRTIKIPNENLIKLTLKILGNWRPQLESWRIQDKVGRNLQKKFMLRFGWMVANTQTYACSKACMQARMHAHTHRHSVLKDTENFSIEDINYFTVYLRGVVCLSVLMDAIFIVYICILAHPWQ